MTKFLIMWKLDNNKTPNAQKELLKMMMQALKVVKENEKHGWEWGTFVSGYEGYCIYEGTEEEASEVLWSLAPYIVTKVYPILSADQAISSLKKINALK